MTTMIAEVYDALLEAGASQEKARAAAKAIAGYDNALADIKSRLRVLEWSAAVQGAMTAAILFRVFLHG